MSVYKHCIRNWTTGLHDFTTSSKKSDFMRRSHHSPYTTLLWALQFRYIAYLNIQCIAYHANDAVLQAFYGLTKRAFLGVAPLDICYAPGSSLCWVSNPRPWIACTQVYTSIPCMHHNNNSINMKIYKHQHLAELIWFRWINNQSKLNFVYQQFEHMEIDLKKMFTTYLKVELIFWKINKMV